MLQPNEQSACGEHQRPCLPQVSDPSLLRFLVDIRDADPSDKQLRDDLMTMLIAGHETTAAVLTWTLFCLMQHPDAAARCVAEVDAVMGDDTPSAPSRCSPLRPARVTVAVTLRLSDCE